MKTRLILAAAIAVSLSSVAYAGQAPDGWKTSPDLLGSTATATQWYVLTSGGECRPLPRATPDAQSFRDNLADEGHSVVMKVVAQAPDPTDGHISKYLMLLDQTAAKAYPLFNDWAGCKALQKLAKERGIIQ